eukprot:g621.t1
MVRGTVAYPWSRKSIRELRIDHGSSANSTEVDSTTLHTPTSKIAPANMSSDSSHSNDGEAQSASKDKEVTTRDEGKHRSIEPSDLDTRFVLGVDAETGYIPVAAKDKNYFMALKHWWFGAWQLSIFAPDVDAELIRILNQLSLQSCTDANERTGISRSGITSGNAVPASWNIDPSNLLAALDADERLRAAIVDAESKIARITENLEQKHGMKDRSKDSNNSVTDPLELVIEKSIYCHKVAVLKRITKGVLKARAGILLFFNHLVEPVLPLIELWQDGTSVSASGWTPTLGEDAVIGGRAPPEWCLGSDLLRAKHYLFTASKWRLLCVLMARTSTVTATSKVSDKNSKKNAASTGVEKTGSSGGVSRSAGGAADSFPLSHQQTEIDIENSAVDPVSVLRPLAKRLPSEPKSSMCSAVPATATQTMEDRRKHSFSSAEFHILLNASAFGQCVAHLHVVPTDMLRFGDGLLPSFALNVNFKDSKRSLGQLMPTDPHCDVPSPLTSPASLSSDGTDGFGQSDQTGRSKQERLFARISEELVWPLRLFEEAEAYQGTMSYRSGSSDKYNDSSAALVPATGYTTTGRHLHLYRFVGKIMGIAIRTGTPFGVRFAPFVWKLLLNPLEELSVEDLAPLDRGGVLQILSDPELAKDYTKEVEEALRASQSEGGQRTPFSVDTDAAGRARTRVLSRRLSNARLAIDEMRTGLLDVVPGHSMHLFTWEECARMVCEPPLRSRAAGWAGPPGVAVPRSFCSSKCVSSTQRPRGAVALATLSPRSSSGRPEGGAAARFSSSAFGPLPPDVDTDADLGEPVFSAVEKRGTPSSTLPSLEHTLPDLPELKPADAVSAPVTEMTTLANGVRVVSQETHRQCSTLCALIKVGSRYETDENAGVTHLLEQMAFRSTTTKSWAEMVGALESIGGVTSVAASREEIMYTVDVLREGAPAAMELLADTVARPSLLSDELEEARQIVGYLLEAGREQPQGLVMEEMTTVAFGGPSTSLGRPLFADPERTEGGKLVPTLDQVRDFHSAHFVGENMVVSAAGLDHAEAVALAEAHFGDIPKHSPPEMVAATEQLRKAATQSVSYTGGGRLVSVDNLPFTHVGIGFETGGWHDDDLVPACVLVAMLGGGDSFSAGGPGKGMYSRLYRKVLNQCAWVESILGVSLIHNDAGCIGIVGSTLPQYAPSLLRVIIDQMLWVATEPAEEEELDRARNRLKSSVLMNLESRLVLGDDMARQVSTYGKRENAEDVCRKIDAVTAEDIMRVSMRGLNSNPSVVAYGDMTSIPDNIHELVQQALKESMPQEAEGQ